MVNQRDSEITRWINLVASRLMPNQNRQAINMYVHVYVVTYTRINDQMDNKFNQKDSYIIR